MTKLMLGFLLGVVWLGYCVSLKKPQVIEVSPDAPAATPTTVATCSPRTRNTSTAT